MRIFRHAFKVAVAAIGLCSMTAVAEIPTSYYSSINGKAEGDLKTAISVLVYNHTKVSSYNALPEYFRQTDSYYEGGVQYWWDMYSDIPVTTSGQFGNYMNREHAFPKSWWGGSTDTPAYVDLNHLYPSEKKANTAKSNWPLGVVSSTSNGFDNGFVKVGYPETGQGGGAQKVFEPNDEYKGDFARTYFYMVTCYQSLRWNTQYMWMLQQNDYPTLKPWAVDLLLKWSREDRVSQKEIDRNEKIYKIQNNRNPFIDYPELAEYIWGNKRGNKFYVGSGEPTGDPVLTTPVQDMALDFNQVAIGNSEANNLIFKGENLKGTISVTITGADKSMFSIGVKSIQSSLVNSESGYALQVTYKPTSLGEHAARLIVSDVTGMEGSLGVALVGECLPVPTLSAPVATAASDITSTSYVANWEEPADVVDYYIVTRTRYYPGESSSEDILAESNSLPIDDYDPSISESYHVRSSRLGYESAQSNEIYLDRSGITDVNTVAPLGWAYSPSGIRFVCAANHTGVRVYDITGRLVTVIPEIENNMVIDLPLGVYLIVTDQCGEPLRVIVNP